MDSRDRPQRHQGDPHLALRLWAIDVRTGKIVGKRTFQPPPQSGMLSTDGGLLFTGHMIGKFAAYDETTLNELWSFNLGTSITAPPMTYSVNGKQYIAIVAGGSTGLGGAGLRQPAAFVACSDSDGPNSANTHLAQFGPARSFPELRRLTTIGRTPM